MKRCLSAPCLAEAADREAKKPKPTEMRTEPNTREYLQLALARVLEIQQEIKDGIYDTQSKDGLGESDTDEEILEEVLEKVFKNLPGTGRSAEAIINAMTTKKQAEIEAIRSKRIQLLGYDTCRRAAIEFMKSVVRGTESTINPADVNFGFRMGTYSANEAKIARRRSGLLINHAQRQTPDTREDYEIRMRMLKSLDLHLAAKQRDYTAKLMSF